jgi:hypothetical protein
LPTLLAVLAIGGIYLLVSKPYFSLLVLAVLAARAINML